VPTNEKIGKDACTATNCLLDGELKLIGLGGSKKKKMRSLTVNLPEWKGFTLG